MPGQSRRPQTSQQAPATGQQQQQMTSPSGKPLRPAEVQVGTPPEVQLYGFRGVRTVNDQKVKDMAPEDPARLDVERITAAHHLLFAGHVGVSVDNGATIYGLTPVFPEGMEVEQGIDHLYAHSMTFPGQVANDKPVFDMADRYFKEKGWNTEVHVVKRPVSKQDQADYMQKLEAMAGMAPGAHGIYYSFPLADAKDGKFFVDTPGPDGKIIKGEDQANCATFPGQIGIELPEQSGNLRYYMPALMAEASGGG